MALLLPAIKGKLGTNDYYVATMKARELAEKIVIPSESSDWLHQDLDSYFQRAINYKRVRDEIAPYFNKRSDRFSGTIIVALQNFKKKVTFQALTSGDNQCGLLMIDGASEFLPIDGQHRALAIKYAISGHDNEGKPLPQMEPNLDLTQEDIPVMLIPFHKATVRKIFMSLNEHAKNPTPNEKIAIGDNLIQALTRSVAASVFTIRLVKIKDKTLELDSPKITTLTSLATGTEYIFDSLYPDLKKYKKKPVKEMGAEYQGIRDAVEKHWQTITNHIDFYRLSMRSGEVSGDRTRVALKKKWLVSRPMVQDCFIHAFSLLIAKGSRFCKQETDAAKALNHLPLKASQMRHWQPFLFSNNQRVVAGNKRFTTQLMVYMASGDYYIAKDKLLQRYREFFPGEPKKQLPDPVK